jgi:hypothetical protein
MLENPSWGSSIMAITMIVSPLWILPRCMKLIPSKWAINPYLCWDFFRKKVSDFIFRLANLGEVTANCSKLSLKIHISSGDSFYRLQKCVLAISFWFPSCILPRDMSFWFANYVALFFLDILQCENRLTIIQKFASKLLKKILHQI